MQPCVSCGGGVWRSFSPSLSLSGSHLSLSWGGGAGG